MNIQELTARIREQKNFLCVGLDSDLAKIPEHIRGADDPLFEFNRIIIEATRAHCVSYKLNTAFYEAQGARGWATLAKTVAFIGSQHYIIADAKRGDIGNTCDMYARAFFEDMQVDAITLAPYMGFDSVSPFLKYKNKSVIVLGVTSNPSVDDFQFLPQADGQPLFRHIIRKGVQWAGPDRLMFVAGATRPELLAQIREDAPDHFLLVPGVGAQGGNLADVVQYGKNKETGLLINNSRGIIYAGNGRNFGEAAEAAARKAAEEMQAEM